MERDRPGDDPTDEPVATPRTSGRAHRHWFRLAGLIAAAVLAAGLSGGATFALWSDSGAAAGQPITSGNLDIATSGALSVECTLCDTTETVPASGHILTPGSTVVVAQRVIIALAGDNIQAGLTVDWPGAQPTVPVGITATYTIADGAGQTMVPATPLGTPATAAGLTPTPGRFFTVTVTADYPATAPVWVPAAGTPAAQLSLGSMRVSLDQVRAGG